jgi:hypothetical protein
VEESAPQVEPVLDEGEDDLTSYWEALRPGRLRCNPEKGQCYVALLAVSLVTPPVVIRKGDTLFFDGVIVEYDGRGYSCPALRGAVKIGWIEPL